MLGIAMTRIKLLETCGEFHRAVKSCVERSVRFDSVYILVEIYSKSKAVETCGELCRVVSSIHIDFKFYCISTL